MHFWDWPPPAVKGAVVRISVQAHHRARTVMSYACGHAFTWILPNVGMGTRGSIRSNSFI